MRTTIAAAAAAGLLAAGCTPGGGGDVESDPAASLRDAVQSLADYEGLQMELAFSGDADALAASQPDADREDIELLLDSELLFAVAGDEDEPEFEARVQVGDTDVFELRVLPAPQVFLRVDAQAFADEADEPELLASLEDLRTTAEQFGLGDLADLVLSGQWIEVLGVDELMEFAEDFGGPTAGEEPSEEEVEALQQRMASTLDRFLAEDVEVVYIGDEPAGERVQATADGASLLELFDELTAIAGDASGVDPMLFGEVPEDDELAAMSLRIDAWLEGGELRQVGVDLSQFDEGELPADSFVLLGLREFTGSVEAPADAEPVDVLERISEAIFGGFGDLGGLGGDLGGELDEEDLEGFEDELGGFDDEDLELPCLTEEELEQAPELQALVDDGVLEEC